MTKSFVLILVIAFTLGSIVPASYALADQNMEVNILAPMEGEQIINNIVPSVTEQMSSIADQLIRVWGYEDGAWRMYDPGDNIGTDLFTLIAGRGYWVKITEDCDLIYDCYSYALKTGWNNIGWRGDCLQSSTLGGFTTGAISTAVAPGPPCRFHGIARIDGIVAANGIAVGASIEGDSFATTTPSVYGDSTYWLQVESPDPEIPYLDGTAITFTIGGLQAHQTGSWEKGGNIELNLSAITPNTPTGIDVEVQAVNPDTGEATVVTLTFSNVTELGATVTTSSSTGPELPSGFMLGDPPVYYDVSTTAEYEGTITICFDYSDIGFIDEDLLTIQHWNESTEEWEPVLITNHDTENDIICGEIQSLSVFAPMMSLLNASVDVKPDTLNLKRKGNVITAYIELPEGYSAADIDLDTLLLNGSIDAMEHPTNIGDYDSDGIADLMVKFDRASVLDILDLDNQVEITISGEVSGTPFEGSDVIRVIN